MPTPVEVYNKRIKKKEKEKRKKARQEVRTSKKLLEEPEKLKKELDELTHKAIIGRIDPESLERKEKIEKLWDQYNKTKQQKEREEQETESEKSEESSSSDESDYSSDSDAPKCVIEIKGKINEEPSKKKRGFHDPDPEDEFALELMNHVPKLDNKEEVEPEKKARKEPKNFKYTPRPSSNTLPTNVPYTLNPPPPPPYIPPFGIMPNFINFGPVPQPPPMIMGQPTFIPPIPQEEKKEDKEIKEKVPFTKYLVPSQVRLNRKNPLK